MHQADIIRSNLIQVSMRLGLWNAYYCMLFSMRHLGTSPYPKVFSSGVMVAFCCESAVLAVNTLLCRTLVPEESGLY